jgi:flagellar FliL protein
MATQAIESVPTGGDAGTSAAEATAKPAGKRTVLIMVLAGLVAGAAAGLFGVGPVLAKRRAAAPPVPKTETGTANAAVTHSIENLVLNPAGSGGTRFLMVTATFELKDGSVEQQMKDHDAEVRDHVLALLGKKTVEELSDITLREGIKQEVLASISELFAKGSVRKVFFPQFVIQ